MIRCITACGAAASAVSRALSECGDPSIATSWSRGRLQFRDTPLADAVNEINRYATKKVRLGDPSLASLPIGGNFIAGDSDLIVDALAAVLPLRIVNGGDKEIILVRRYDGGRH